MQCSMRTGFGRVNVGHCSPPGFRGNRLGHRGGGGLNAGREAITAGSPPRVSVADSNNVVGQSVRGTSGNNR